MKKKAAAAAAPEAESATVVVGSSAPKGRKWKMMMMIEYCGNVVQRCRWPWQLVENELDRGNQSCFSWKHCRGEVLCTLASFSALVLLMTLATVRDLLHAQLVVVSSSSSGESSSSSTHNNNNDNNVMMLLLLTLPPWLLTAVGSAVLWRTLFRQRQPEDMDRAPSGICSISQLTSTHPQAQLCFYASPPLFLLATLSCFLQLPHHQFFYDDITNNNNVQYGGGFLLSLAIPSLVTAVPIMPQTFAFFFSAFLPFLLFISSSSYSSSSSFLLLSSSSGFSLTNALLFRLRSQKASRMSSLLQDALSENARLRHDLETASAAEEKLNKMRGFLSYVFHEIRVPFNAVMLGIGHLQASQVTSDQQETLQMMESSSSSMIDILNNVLDMGKIESGKFELEVLPFNMGEMVNSLRLSFKSPMEARGIRFVEMIEARAKDIFTRFDVLGDKHRIRQVIANYLSNAAKFTPANGQVTLRIFCSSETEGLDVAAHTQASNHNTTSEEKTSVAAASPENIKDAEPQISKKKVVEITVSVEDTGIGISKEHQELLFQPYMQIRAGATQDGGGTGLGLSFAKLIVELAGGKSWVSSELGKGSVFSFSIPFTLVDRIEDGGPGKIINSQGNSFKIHTSPRIRNGKAKVLVIEDSMVNRKILRKLLDSFGIETHDAENGEKAIQLIEEGASFDLILVDKEMPKMDGHEVTRRLRAMGVKSLMIGLSGNALISDRNQFLAAGVDDFYTKPMSRNQLVNLLELHSLIPKPKEDEQNTMPSTSTSTPTNNG